MGLSGSRPFFRTDAGMQGRLDGANRLASTRVAQAILGSWLKGLGLGQVRKAPPRYESAL